MSEASVCNKDKRTIRREVLALRDRLTKEELDRGAVLITERILGHQWYYNADVLFGFVSYGSEIETRFILEDALLKGKKVYLPKIVGDEMQFFKVEKLEDLAVGYKGILEPVTGECFGEDQTFLEEHKALMLMPGVAFDLYRNRIGYGKGFYDRYLEKYPYFRTFSIAIGHKIQMVEQIPAEDLDVKPYQVICV